MKAVQIESCHLLSVVSGVFSTFSQIRAYKSQLMIQIADIYLDTALLYFPEKEDNMQYGTPTKI